jgi:hypothetical protein
VLLNGPTAWKTAESRETSTMQRLRAKLSLRDTLGLNGLLKQFLIAEKEYDKAL